MERDHYFAIVIDGYRDGLQAWEIAERIGDTAQHVSARAARLRADGVDVPFGRRGMHRSPGGPWVPVLVKDTITCTMCGKQTPREGGHQKYCPDCRVVARREGSTRRQREMAHRRATPCIDCGGPCGREGAERCRRCDRARRSRRARERAEEYLSLRKSGFTNAEIAEWCGVSPNEVSGAIHRYCPNAPRAPHPKRRTEVAS